MKTYNNYSDIINDVESNNFYFQGQQFDSFADFYSSAKEHFSDFDFSEEYYHSFGLEFGDVRCEKVKSEKFISEDGKEEYTVDYYESYIDSGVGKEDYFYGYIIHQY